MLICIEGCIGAGKSTLVERLASLVKCLPLFEEFDSNPFLSDFYRDPMSYALHVQYTFLFLQERIFRKGLECSLNGELVICDFHPVKSKIFSNIVLTSQAGFMLTQMYDLLFPSDIFPDLMIYLRPNIETILSRIKKRNDIYDRDIEQSYLDKVYEIYEDFFIKYANKILVIDNTEMDYENEVSDLYKIFGMINNSIAIASHLRR